MRDFYKQILQNLYIYCGNRQVDKMEDSEITLLLDGLCRLSNLYAYIPEQSQKEIVLTCLVTDREYQNINVRLVSKWFEINGKKFFKEEAHKETKEYEPATPEQREQRLKEWQEAIAKTENNFIVKPVSNAELMREKFHGANAEPTNYKTDPKVTEQKERHFEYIKENYAPDGNCLETWLPENEWLKQNYPEI